MSTENETVTPASAPGASAGAAPPRAQGATRGPSLRTKWTAALLALAVFPLAALSPVVLRQQRAGLLHAEESHQNSVMDHASDLLERVLIENARAVSHLSSLLADPRITDEDAKISLVRSVLERAESLDSAVIYGADGAKIDVIIRGEAVAALPSPESLPAALRQTEDRGRWLEPEVDPQRGLRLRFLQPLGRNGARTGWVLGQLKVDVASRFLAALSRDHFEDRTDGLVLFNPSFEVLASSRGDADAELRPGTSIAGRELLAQVNMPPERFTVLFLGSGEYRRADGSSWVGSVRTVPDMRVAILARRPAEAVFTTLAATRKAVLLGALALGLVSLAAGAWIASRTTRPILALIKLAKEFAARRFSARSSVRTGDELEALGFTMESMADDLSASEKEIARRAAVEKDLSRFLPATVAAEIAEGRRKLELGGERREVSVLFADVVSFTPFAERAAPEKVVEFLNELFTVLTEVVFRHEGTVDKFIGDAVMAFFGAPNAAEDHAERALACAEDMHRFVEASAPEWREKYGIDVRIAVGVNSGAVLVGNLGSESRMDYTVIGDVVNVAARLEGLARPGQTLVTGETARGAKDAFEFRPLGEHPLRGKEQPVPILELVR